MKPDDLLAKVTELLDRDQIRQVLARYCRGQDRQDVDLLRSAYWADGWDDHGMWEGPPEAFAEACTTQWPLARVEHMLGQSYIELDGAFANAETYFFNHNRMGAEGSQVDNLVGGRYNDRLEKRGDTWKILHRVVTYDWYHLLGPSAPWDNSLFPFGDMPSRSYGETAQDYSRDLFANQPFRKGETFPRGFGSARKP